MNNQIPSIHLLADDIPAKEIEAFLLEKFPDESIALEVSPLNKEGRGVNEIVSFVFSADIGANLLASFIYDFIIFSFSKLRKSSGAEPKATIDLGDGVKVEIPDGIGEVEIKIKIKDSVTGKKVYSLKIES